MADATIIKIDGLREFQRALKQAEDGLQKELRLMFNDVVTVVADSARAMVPHSSGAAAASIKPQSTQRMGQIKAGGAKAPYYAWLDFGGRVGRHKSVHRDFLKSGRYLYPSYSKHKGEIEQKLVEGLTELLRKSGLATE